MVRVKRPHMSYAERAELAPVAPSPVASPPMRGYAGWWRGSWGHWEGDLLAGTRQSHVVTLVERSSRRPPPH